MTSAHRRDRPDTFDLIVVGAGPAGYGAALYGAAGGMSVALVEQDKVGGTSLHRGCVPAKELLQTASVVRAVSHAGEFGINAGATHLDFTASQERKRLVVEQLFHELSSLLAKREVTVVAGRASLAAPGRVTVERRGTSRRELSAPCVILATGSSPEGLAGFRSDGEVVLSSDEVLELASVPSSVAVIGGGAVGCELASMLHDLGARVTVLEIAPSLLPAADSDVARVVERAFSRRGIDVRTGAQVLGEERGEAGTAVLLAEGEKLEVALAVVAVGRTPRSAGLIADGTGVRIDAQGFVAVDEWMRTGADGVFAVGDLVATPQLAHVGFAEAILAVKQILGEHAQAIDYEKVAWCLYCEPEVAFAGLTEEAARRAGHDVLVVRDAFAGNGRARIIGDTDGFVKVVAARAPDGTAGPILGVHMVGPWVTEQLGQAYLALNWGASPDELAGLIQPHPTLSETYGETLLSLAGRGLHLS